MEYHLHKKAKKLLQSINKREKKIENSELSASIMVFINWKLSLLNFIFFISRLSALHSSLLAFLGKYQSFHSPIFSFVLYHKYMTQRCCVSDVLCYKLIPINYWLLTSMKQHTSLRLNWKSLSMLDSLSAFCSEILLKWCNFCESCSSVLRNTLAGFLGSNFAVKFRFSSHLQKRNIHSLVQHITHRSLTETFWGSQLKKATVLAKSSYFNYFHCALSAPAMSTDVSQVGVALYPSLKNIFYHFTFPGFPFTLMY